MAQARIIGLVLVAVGSAFLAGFGVAAVTLRPVMEAWRRKYYHEKRVCSDSIQFMGEALKYLKDREKAAFREFCEMLRGELRPLTKQSFGRGANAAHRIRMTILLGKISDWIDEHYP